MLCFRLLFVIVLTSNVYDACVCVCVCVCVVHSLCSAQMSMFNMEKRCRNKIIIIIIIMTSVRWGGAHIRALPGTTT